MAAPKIFRSTDTGAPVLTGQPIALLTLLDAILVNGYGSLFASGTITNDGTNVADGDTVTVGSVTYTFRSSLTSQPANTVLIGASGTASLVNLREAINGSTAASTYTATTLANPDAFCPSSSVGLLTITARKGGSAGNSLALARTAAGTAHIGVSSSTLTGGSGTDTKTSAGWTKPYTGSVPSQQAVYRQPAGSGYYLQIDDAVGSFTTSGGRDARACGFEVMTAYNTGTGQFPTVAQVGAQLVPIRKAINNDNVSRPWIAFADDRTFYLYVLTGDIALTYHGFSFGDFVSNFSGDTFKCMIMGAGSTESSSSITASNFGQHVQPSNGVTQAGHFLSRNYSGLGGPTMFVKTGDTALASLSGTTPGNIQGNSAIVFPNQSDGALYLAPLRIFDGNIPSGSSVGTTLNNRGRLRGMYQVCHQATSFSDGDVFVGTGEYAGRSFQIVKLVVGSSGSTSAFVAMETTAWDV